MNSFASLALATEPPKVELLNRHPVSRHAYIISRKMVKHILGVAIFEIIVIYSIAFGGDHFFPEPNAKYRFERADLNNFVYPGRLIDWDMTPLYSEKYEEFGASRHYTNVFNIFVVMNIFNLLNARKIHDEKNIFKGILSNKVFLIVWAFIAIS